MSHHKHTTEAFILSAVPSREHDMKIKMITAEGEVLTAIATGLRTLQSKLRMSVVPYAHVIVSIVRGRDIWRLTNAQVIQSFYYDISDTQAKKALARTVSLCEKLTPGESYIGNVFSILTTYARRLAQGVDGKVNLYETQAALHILSELGYIENVEKWATADIAYIETHIKEAIEEINYGIASTHLA